MNHSLDNSLDNSLEEALRQMDPGPPPPDMAARCIAALPETRRPNLLGWLTQNKTPRRLVLTAAFLALLTFWVTWPTLRKQGVTQAPASAFARTLEAMGRVTAWRVVDQQIGFDPGDGKTRKFRYNFKAGFIKSFSLFDAQRGEYTDTPPRDGVTIQRTLMLPNGDWYFRLADLSQGRDKVRITHMGKAHWQQRREEALKNLCNPSYWTNNLDRPAITLPLQRTGRWKGRPAIVFTFRQGPSRFYKASAPPTTRTEVYVDPDTQRIVAQRAFARWPDHPEWGEHLIQLQEYDYSPQDSVLLFDPKHFCKRTTEIQEQAGGPGVTLDPQ